MKTKKQVLAEIEDHLKKTFRDSFTPELFKLAKAKAATWQKNAYGTVDWIEHYGESGVECVDYFFKECLATKNDANSHNRQMARQRRN